MNVTLNLNWESGELVRLKYGNIVDVAAEKISRGFRSQQVLLCVELTLFCSHYPQTSLIVWFWCGLVTV